MKLVITIDCDNDAFHPDITTECISILHQVERVLARFDDGQTIGGHLAMLRDSNGNTVGEARFVEDDPDFEEAEFGV
jgi:hypothetical protein